MNTLKRLSLGQKASIGTLYDAHNDTFLDSSLLVNAPDQPLPADAITTTDLRNATTTSRIIAGTVKEKFETLGVTPELGASLLAGLVPPRGSARYLTQQGDSVPAAQRAVVYTVTSRMEQLSFLSGSARERLDLGVLETDAAGGVTHVLTGITWGARAIVSVRRRVGQGMEMAECEEKVEEITKGFLSPQTVGNTATTDDSIHLRLYTDAREALDGSADDATDAMEHFAQLKPYVEATGGKPLVYMLLPIAFLVTLGAVVTGNTTAGQLSPECYDKLVRLFDHMGCVQQTMNAHHQKLLQQRALVSDAHLSEVEDQLQKVRQGDSDLRLHYAEALKAVRGNLTTSQRVSELIDKVLAGIPSAQELAALTIDYGKKLDFVSRAVGLGATHVGGAEESLQEILDGDGKAFRTMYAFHFTTGSIDTDNTGWTENRQLLEELLTKARPKPYVLVVDCDAHRRKIPHAYISVYARGILVVDNLLEQNKELAGKHLVQYDRASLEPINDVPSYRKSVRIPCPGPYCNSNDICLWICCECQETIEFGSRDGYFYCDCGRVPFDKVGFNCQKSCHKSGYSRFKRNHLRNLLSSLPAPREMNILILGETGVGKSTFVNAFINYLTFGSLDDGLKNPRLNCVIPCSFTTQLVDTEGRMISRDIAIGSDNDEVDGSKGQSATQKATVYPLYFRDTLIRLIDTPGIGDTRGLEQDKQNMANMLSILRNYPALHGILILLKPNNARLGVMFRFCVKELLTHLHTSAAQNMVFGFTNTRGSNYTPGDTFKPLESLLADYHNVIPQLSRSNVYCFDSESFRYLAAKKQGIDMGHIDDYRRSWEHSSKEADRLLAHFQSLHPHHTQETLSLNETRHLIAQLTAPMQQISVAITDTIARSEQQVLDLKDAKLTGDELRSKLHIQKTTVKAEQLDKPKTVCANTACVESVFDEGSNADVLLRKKLCHNPCCLTNVPVGKVGTPQLENCAAFDGAHCCVCGHHWKEHEHILVEYSKQNKTVTDASVQRELNTNGNVINAKEKAVRALQKHIAELKQEHKQVQTAAAKFSLYLKNNSITHYNDATIEYLEHLIKDERTKVRTGQNRARLDSLEKDLDDYRKFVETMEQGNSDSDGQTYVPLNEASVANLVQTLYNLPHYGQMLKDLAQVVANAYEANFRERPYRMSRRRIWRDHHEATTQNWSPPPRRGTSVRNSGWGWENQFPRTWGMETSSASASQSMGNHLATRPVMPGTFDQSDNQIVNYERNRNSAATLPSGLSAEKSLPNPSGPQHRNQSAVGFWPSPEKQGSQPTPVQSILSWGGGANATNTRESTSALPRTAHDVAPNPFLASSLSVSAPPPYPGPSTSSRNLASHNRPLPDEQTNLVERKGIWLRLKERLRRW